MSQNVTIETQKLQPATWHEKDIAKLTGLINQSLKEVNQKFIRDLKAFKTKREIPEIDITKIKENKEIYSAFKAMRDEHIHYFKKYPRYVRHELNNHLGESKYTVTFEGPKIAKAAHEVAMAQKKVQKRLENNLELAKDIARRHANFIARDQLGKFTASLHEAQSKYIGATKYIWQTSLDNRVRPEHAAREGKVFEYAKPPKGGNPGIDYRCRCAALAIVEFEQ